MHLIAARARYYQRFCFISPARVKVLNIFPSLRKGKRAGIESRPVFLRQGKTPTTSSGGGGEGGMRWDQKNKLGNDSDWVATEVAAAACPGDSKSSRNPTTVSHPGGQRQRQEIRALVGVIFQCSCAAAASIAACQLTPPIHQPPTSSSSFVDP